MTDPGRAAGAPQIVKVDTPAGPARWHRWVAGPSGRPTGEPRGTLVLGHGAGGRDWSADLLALTGLAADGWDVTLVEQPWRVTGRKVAAASARLDEAWLAVLADLERRGLTAGGEARRPLVVGGRSAGARVACRTATAVGACGLVALAFPLHPPGRPDRSRAAELAEPGDLPLLIVQGGSDPFGRPVEFDGVLLPAQRLVAVSGGHGFGPEVGPVTQAVRRWLAERFPS